MFSWCSCETRLQALPNKRGVTKEGPRGYIFIAGDRLHPNAQTSGSRDLKESKDRCEYSKADAVLLKLDMNRNVPWDGSCHNDGSVSLARIADSSREDITRGSCSVSCVQTHVGSLRCCQIGPLDNGPIITAGGKRFRCHCR